MAFAPIFECSNCGDVWKVEVFEFIDEDRDEIYPEVRCQCGASVREKVVDGKPVWHPLSEDEMIDETTDYSDPYSY